MSSIDAPPRNERYSSWEQDGSIRREFIGGSDIPIIVGAYDWRTNLDVWQEKRGESDPWEGNARSEAGKRMEPTIVRWYEEERPTVTAEHVKTGTWSHPDYPHLAGSPDAFAICTDRGFGCGEAKNVGENLASRWPEGTVDESAKLQCVWNCGIVGAKWGFVAAIVGGWEFRYEEFDFDPDIFAWLVAEANKFWEHVTNGTVPDIHVAHPLAAQSLANVYQIDESLDAVALHDSELATFEHWAELRATAKQVKDDMASLKAGINQALGNAKEAMIGGKTVVAISEYDKRTVKADLLLEKYPEVHADPEIWSTSKVRKLMPKSLAA